MRHSAKKSGKSLNAIKRTAAMLLCVALLVCSASVSLGASETSPELLTADGSADSISGMQASHAQTLQPQEDVTSSPAHIADEHPETSTNGADATQNGLSQTITTREAHPTAEPIRRANKESAYILHVRPMIWQANANQPIELSSRTISLTTADFDADGIYSLAEFAQEFSQPGEHFLLRSSAGSVAISDFEQTSSGTYEVTTDLDLVPQSGWLLTLRSKEEISRVSPTGPFEGVAGTYVFTPANVLTIKIDYAFSPTGGLADTPVADPECVQIDPANLTLTANGYEWRRLDSYPGKYLPKVSGFRFVLDPDPLNQFFANQEIAAQIPTASQEQLQQWLDNGDLSVDPEMVYYDPLTGANNPKYSNIYTDQYNEAWKDVRRDSSKDYYTAQLLDNEKVPTDASQMADPTLRVTIPEDKMDEAVRNGIDVHVYYRRQPIQYWTYHWIPKDLWENYTDHSINLTVPDVPGNTQDGYTPSDCPSTTTYICVGKGSSLGTDGRPEQARQNALSHATALDVRNLWSTANEVPSVHATPVNQRISPETIPGNNTISTTAVNVYYEPEDVCIIFGTTYTYIPREFVPLGTSIDLSTNAVTPPSRHGQRFAGWYYLTRAGQQALDAMGSGTTYNPMNGFDATYCKMVEGTPDTWSLLLRPEYVEGDIPQDAPSIVEDETETKALYLYPYFTPGTTTVRICLWVEDLADPVTGIEDVQVKAEGGIMNRDASDPGRQAYEEWYKDYATYPRTVEPEGRGKATGYVAMRSFTIQIPTDTVLTDTQPAQGSNGLMDYEYMLNGPQREGLDVRDQVEAEFQKAFPRKDLGILDVFVRSKRYVNEWNAFKPYKFEILHKDAAGSGFDDSLRANTDGNTSINVYYTRNVYAAKFIYFGQDRRSQDIPENISGCYGYTGYANDNYKGPEALATDPLAAEVQFGVNNPNPESASAQENTFLTMMKSESMDWNERLLDESQMPCPRQITVYAKYGATLRSTWPTPQDGEPARPLEQVNALEWRQNVMPGPNSQGESCVANLMSWVFTNGRYAASSSRDTAVPGRYSSMDARLIEDVQYPCTRMEDGTVDEGWAHSLIGEWYPDHASDSDIYVYNYNHLILVDDLQVTSSDISSGRVKEIYVGSYATDANGSTMEVGPTDNQHNLLYLVPKDDAAFTKWNFNDLQSANYLDDPALRGWQKVRLTPDNSGAYYVVRAYQYCDPTTWKYNDPNTWSLTTSYFALRRSGQVQVSSQKEIWDQNASARPHMSRLKIIAEMDLPIATSTPTTALPDCSVTQNDQNPTDPYAPTLTKPPFADQATAENPFNLYFYYTRDTFVLTYAAPVNSISGQAAEYGTTVLLGRAEVPYGAELSQNVYGPQLDYREYNYDTYDAQGKAEGHPWYVFPYDEDTGAFDLQADPIEKVPVCPDRNPDGQAPWTFAGWAYGPSGVNRIWPDETTHVYAHGNLTLYASWTQPADYTVTFHMNGGTWSQRPDGLDPTADYTHGAAPNIRYGANSGAVIPRPMRAGYRLINWLDEDGNEFDASQPIHRNMSLTANWEYRENREFCYRILCVTRNPVGGSAGLTDIYVKNGDTTLHEPDLVQSTPDPDAGFEHYYLLGDPIVPEASPAPIISVNPPSKRKNPAVDGYLPIDPGRVGRTVELTEGEDASSDIVFYYDPLNYGTYDCTVRIVNVDDRSQIVRTSRLYGENVHVVTPDPAVTNELATTGWKFVNLSKSTGGYEIVSDLQTLNWYDTAGNAHSPSRLPETGSEIIYYVKPDTYTISYTADPQTPETMAALHAVAGNPATYTPGTQTLIVENPRGTQIDGKRYVFRGWSLQGSDTLYNPLTIPQGSYGNLAFVAHWIDRAQADLHPVIQAANPEEARIENSAEIGRYLTGEALTANAEGHTVSETLELVSIEAAFGADEFEIVVTTPDGTTKQTDDIVATGDKLVLVDRIEEDVSTDSVTIVVRGDVLGTGKINLTQLVRVAQTYKDGAPWGLQGAYLEAAQLDELPGVQLTDVVLEAALYRAALLSKGPA